MIFGTKSMLRRVELPVTLGPPRSNLSRTDKFNYLGLVLDPGLSMVSATLALKKMVSHKIFTLSVIRKDIPLPCAVTLYKTMILPFFDYINFCLNACTEKEKN